MKYLNSFKWFVLLYLCSFFSVYNSFANGHLEQARSIFNGDYKSQYEEAIKNIEQSNFNAAKESLDKFKELQRKMQDDFDWIDHQKDVLNNDSKNLWNDFFSGSSSPWSTLCITSGTLEGDLGVRSYNNSLEKMKDAYKRCGELLAKIYDVFKENGKKIFGKQIAVENILRNYEQAKLLYFGDAESQYLEMIKNIDQSNFAAAKESAGRFKEQLMKVDNYFVQIDHDKEVLNSETLSLWNDLYNGSGTPWRMLNINTGGLGVELGSTGYTNSLEKVKDLFKKCGEEMNKIHESFKNHLQGHSEKQKKMLEICDSCN